MIYVMGTGSRSMLTHPDRREIYSVLEYKILLMAEQDEVTLITGMAEGWDEAIAKVGLRNNIPYLCYVPTYSYGEYYWGKKSLLGHNRLNIFQDLLKGAQDVHFVCGNNLYVNGEHANFVRNRAMVGVADQALVYNPSSPGTAHCVRMLKANKVPYSVYPFMEQLTIPNL